MEIDHTKYDRPLSQIPKQSGTYLLLVSVAAPLILQIGKLGEYTFTAGNYVYVGSAHGPGGLHARLKRHLRAEKTLHWHIDYLTLHAPITAIGWCASPDRLECTWAHTVQAQPGVSVPVARFGSSDCQCPAHLFKILPGALASVYAALGEPASITV